MMISTEGIIYGITAGFWGIGIGVPLTYLFYRAARTSFAQGMLWRFPVLTVLVTFASVTLICLFSYMNSSKSLFSSTVVDSIRSIE